MPTRLKAFFQRIIAPFRRIKKQQSRSKIPAMSVQSLSVIEKIHGAEQKHLAGKGKEVRSLFSDPVYLSKFWREINRTSRKAERVYVESLHRPSVSDAERKAAEKTHWKLLKVVAKIHKVINRHLTQDPKFEKALNPRAFESNVFSFLREKPKKSFSMATMDLDYFKKINEKLGHDAADVLLETMVGVLHDRLKSKNIFFARVGGDEFRVFGDIDPVRLGSELQATVLDIHRVVGEMRQFDGIRPTFSIGIASMNSVPGGKDLREIFEWLNEKSDLGAYQAKGNERNNIVVIKNN